MSRDRSPDRTNGHVRRTLEGVIGVPATEGNAIEVLRNGDRDLPGDARGDRGAEHTIDFLTFVYWQGEIGTRVRRGLVERARAGVRVRVLLDGWGAHPIERDARRCHGGAPACRCGGSGRCALPARPGEPPHPPQGADRRRGDRVHRRGRDRRRVAGRRPRRVRVARHALPGPRARRSTGCARRSSTTGPRPTTSCSTRPSTASRRSRKPGPSVVQCVRGASEIGLERRRHAVPHAAAAGRAAGADHDRLLRARRRDHRASLRRRRSGGARSRSCCPARTPTSGSCSWRARRRTTELLERGVQHLELPAVDAARQGHDGRRRSSRTSARPT